MTFFEEVEKHFGVQCLYGALDIAKDANDKQIKRAYHKFSLLCHPDRATPETKDINKSKFQILAKIHSILSNKDKRTVYDDTGEILDESDILTQNRDWEDYWRILFKKITKEDIKLFESEYKHSAKEEADLKKCYVDCEGDMGKILDNIMCSTVDDEDRFEEMIKKWIGNGEVPEYDAFTGESKAKKKKRKKQAKEEEEEAEDLAKELGLDKNKSLEDMILARRVDREKESNDFFANLEAKYGQKDKGKKKTSGKRKRK